jgi:hypothetical protein
MERHSLSGLCWSVAIAFVSGKESSEAGAVPAVARGGRAAAVLAGHRML